MTFPCAAIKSNNVAVKALAKGQEKGEDKKANVMKVAGQRKCSILFWACLCFLVLSNQS